MKTGIYPLLLGLLLVPDSSPQGEEALGRLFFTPPQRAALDRQRTEKDLGTADRLRVDGEIWRQAKRRARWINGQAEEVEKVSQPALPVGDTLHPATGEKESLLGNGRLTIRPAEHGK